MKRNRARNFLDPVNLRRSGKTFLVRFPDLPEALTEGATREEAMENAFDCLEEAIASRIAEHEDIPSPGFLKDGFAPAVALSALMSAKAALYLARREAGLSNVQLAKRLDLDERQVRRLQDPATSSRLPEIDRAIDALGQRLEVRLVSKTPKKKAAPSPKRLAAG
jgi:antitoxin HicB